MGGWAAGLSDNNSGGGGEDTSSVNCLQYQISYTTANTEQAFVIPDSARKIFIQPRRSDVIFRVSYTENGTIDGGGAQYTTVFFGNSYIREGIKLTGKTLYYQANKNNIIFEIEIWI